LALGGGGKRERKKHQDGRKEREMDPPHGKQSQAVFIWKKNRVKKIEGERLRGWGGRSEQTTEGEMRSRK